MVMRDIIEIDDEKCDGCGQCIPNCVEGALQIINGKARLISDELCDGIGMCLGHCPQGALTVTKRDTDVFSEEAVELLTKQMTSEQGACVETGGRPDPRSNHSSPGGHPADSAPQPSPCGCPGTQHMVMRPASHGSDGDPQRSGVNAGDRPSSRIGTTSSSTTTGPASVLGHWPIKLHLVSEQAPFLKDADLLVLADCAGVASHDLHSDLLKEKAVVIFCPKFEDPDFYRGKLQGLVANSGIRSVTIGHMEVPCCFGLGHAVKEAVTVSGRDIPVEHIIIGRDGNKQRK